MMPLKTVYLVGRPQDLNSTMSLCRDGVRIVLPNYTEVLLEVPEQIAGDAVIFELQVPPDRLRVSMEGDRRGQREVARLWEGPHTVRNLPQRKVGGLISLYQAEKPPAISPTVESLRAVVRSFPDEVLMAMPHIGPETLENLLAWAQES